MFRSNTSLTSIINASLNLLSDIFQSLHNITEQAYCQLTMEITILEKALPSEHYHSLKVLLSKAYSKDVSPECMAVVEKYVAEGSEKLKRIIDTLN